MKWSKTIILLSIVLTGLQSCRLAGDDDIPCETRIPIEGQEFFIIERDGQTLVIPSVTAPESLLLCEELTIPDVGYDSIFQVYGLLIQDCETGQCLEIDSVQNPVCEVQFAIDSAAISDLFNDWNIAYYANGTDTLYPSCNSPELTISFERNFAPNTSFPHAAEALIGVNSVAYEFAISGDTLFTDDFSISTAEPQPYVKLVEENLESVLLADTLFFEIDFNQMIIREQGTDRSVTLYR
jgi:hypothetical protein